MYTRIFVVEDEPALQHLLRAYLERAGFLVETFADGLAALQAIDQEPPDLVLLDILLPGLDGLSLIKRLRLNHNHLPIILLTAKSTEADRIQGLQIGADDYVVKPFSPSEVVLRVQAVLRRVKDGMAPSAALRAGPIHLDPGRHEAMVHGNPVDLTPSEFRLLEVMMQHPEQTFTRQQLLDHIAGPDFLGFDRNVDVHIANLRKKLRLKPSPIQTIYGVGYRLSAAFS